VPLTTAHAAAALPLHRWALTLGVRLPLSALVVGSMAPDFEYLLRLEPAGRFGHSPLGLITFCVPLGVAAWWVFEALVAPALLAVVPPALAATLRRAATSSSRAGGRVARATLAVFLGAASHVVWDGFTHAHGWAVAWLPSLRDAVAPTLWPELVWFRLLQHVSTVFGSLVIVVAVGRWLAHQPPVDFRFAPGQRPRAIAAARFMLGATGLGAVVNGARGASHGIVITLAFAAVGAMTALAIALLTYSLATTSLRRAERL
jgi:hypothetical protein